LAAVTSVIDNLLNRYPDIRNTILGIGIVPPGRSIQKPEL